MSLVKTEFADSIGTITMNHIRKHNALSQLLIGEIITALQDFKQKKARVVILRAPPGAKIWSAGHDVKELPLTRRDPLGWDDPLRMVIREIETLPIPVIAMIEGGVWGGACEMAFACDMIVATVNSTFAITPAKLGVPYNTTGVLNFMHATSRVILREMAFTAQQVTAPRAEVLGMINYVVEKEELEARVNKLAGQIKRNAPLSIAVIKEQLRIMESAHPVSPRMFERIQGLRREVYDSHDYKEGLSAFLEKRKPEFTGE
ncbi:MAG: methylmalonyl-CoA decarboxylase [Sedimenticolaceae bacterium]|jgi:methylmalonyl-CoA decarboxylase